MEQINSFNERLEKAKELGFDIVPYIYAVDTHNPMEDTIGCLRMAAEEYSYPIDGMVVTYDDILYGLSLGVTDKFPRHSLAYKFYDEEYETMVSLIAPENKEEKTMFKWDNGFSWAYTGNITDSDIKENVKAAGGSVTGIVRFSIQWNDGDGKDNSDLDAHCVEPGVGDHIFFGHKVSRHTNGNLDIDITHPLEQCRASKGVAVENITFPSKANMIPGTYRFYVNQYSYRNSQGFKAEIEVNGEIHSYEYNHPVRGDVDVAEVILDNEGNFKVVDKLSGNCATVSKDVWGIKTLQFVPVSVVCYSPNYWDEQKGIGHQHLFFMLKNCVNPEEPNGFYNEFLKSDLEKHKRVFEALGAKAHVKDVDDQLSGVGFSLTKRNDLVVKVKGNTERVLKIKF